MSHSWREMGTNAPDLAFTVAPYVGPPSPENVRAARLVVASWALEQPDPAGELRDMLDALGLGVRRAA